MNDRARMLFGLAIVLVLVGVGAFVYARYEMEARIRSYDGAVDSIGFGRGGSIPTQEEFTRSARAAAEELGLEVVSLEVTRTEQSGRDGVGNLMQERMGNLGTIRMQLVRYDVQTTVVAHKWMFSRTGELRVDRTYRQEVHLDTPDARPPPVANDEPPQPRGI